MDKWIIRKRNEPAADDASEPTAKIIKTRDWKNVTRSFQECWVVKFLVMQVNGKPICLLCKKCFNENKADSLKKHFNKMHGEFDIKFPIDTQKRINEIARLKSELQVQKQNIKQFLTSNELVTLASYKTAWIIARHKKPFTDAEMVKEIVIAVMETLLTNYDLKVKDDILQKVKNLQLSHQTIVRRIIEISKNLEVQLHQHLKNCLCFSLALDESTDISDTAQLIIWVRYVLPNFSIREEILGLCGLRNRTCGTDILENFLSVSKKCDLNLKKLYSVTTDGAPAMTGVKSGFVALLKQHLKNNGIKTILPSFHCILHQENLCAQMYSIDTLKYVMDTVVKIVNFIRSGSSLIHRQFVESLKNCEDCAFTDLSDFANVRWLSRGKVLERFTLLLPQIREFLVQKGQIDNFANIGCPSWQCDLHFLCDAISHLNTLNVKLQGRGKIICEQAQLIQEFKFKLNVILHQLQKNDFTHFENVAKFLAQTENFKLGNAKQTLYIQWMKNLAEKFELRFSDFNNFKIVFQFMRNPFQLDIVNTSSEIATLLSLEKRDFENDLIALQNMGNLKVQTNCSITKLWENILTNEDFPTLNTGISQLLSMFGSTWACESFFSTMAFMKTKYRSRLLDVNLEAELRCAFTDYQPHFEKLVKEKNCQNSH